MGSNARDRKMTPGQMRQLATRILAATPANLPFSVAARLLEGDVLRRVLDLVWKNYFAVEAEEHWVRVVVGDLEELIFRRGFTMRGPDYEPVDRECWESAFKNFAFGDGEDKDAVTTNLVHFDGCYPPEIWRRLADNGYRSASFREMHSFALAYPHLVTLKSDIAIVAGTGPDTKCFDRLTICDHTEDPHASTAEKQGPFYLHETFKEGDGPENCPWNGTVIILAVKL